MTDVLRANEVAWRKDAVAKAVHNNRMEGLDLEDEAREDLEEFVLGRLDLEGVRERARRRHGVG